MNKERKINQLCDQKYVTKMIVRMMQQKNLEDARTWLYLAKLNGLDPEEIWKSVSRLINLA